MDVGARLRQEMSQFASRLRQVIYGESGAPAWGTLLKDLESCCWQAGDMLSQELMQQCLTAQAQQVPESAEICPQCQGPVTKLDQEASEPHTLDTCRGPVDWSEPKRYCRRCRQAFFPSEPSLGDTR